MEAPQLSCPTNITIPAQDKLHYSSVRWPNPASIDNSGYFPLVTSVPVVKFPMKFKIGTTEVKVRPEYFSCDEIFNPFIIIYVVSNIFAKIFLERKIFQLLIAKIFFSQIVQEFR